MCIRDRNRRSQSIHQGIKQEVRGRPEIHQGGQSKFEGGIEQ